MRRLPGLRLLPAKVLRPQIHPPIIRRPVLATLAQTTAHASAEAKFNPCSDFYRTKMDLGFFSCDWEHFSFRQFFAAAPQWHGVTELEFLVKHFPHVQGTIFPLAYLSVAGPCIVFEAGGKYHFLSTTTEFLESFDGAFASDDEFLAAFTRPPHIRGMVHEFPEDMDDVGSNW
ncbi:hypothetical protein C8R45DRAFT_1072369 [Mycena sanguinolenta]|nr:hypothetical protein C8R45DRAFT_1072369 [Mycena sanguinolenta]